MKKVRIKHYLKNGNEMNRSKREREIKIEIGIIRKPSLQEH